MKILIVQTGFLGDVILSTPVIANIKALFPDAEVTFLTTPQAQELVSAHPLLSRTMTFAKRGADGGLRGLLAMAKRLRQEHFDKVFSLHKSLRTSVLLRLAGIPERYGFAEAAGKFLYSKTSPRKDLPHDVLRNLAILRNIGKDPQQLDQRLTIALKESDKQKAQGLLPPAEVCTVGLAPGSVWLTKRWTEEGFAEVASAFARDGCRVVLIGGQADRPIAARIKELSKANLTDLTGMLSLAESAAVVAQLDLLVTNDSAPLHMASAFGVPTVALFCATSPVFGFGPWQTASEVVGLDGLSCRPCRRHGANYCPAGTHACRLQLTPEMVLAASKRVQQRVRSGQ